MSLSSILHLNELITLACMRKRKKSYALHYFYTWTRLKYKKTLFFLGPYKGQLAYLRLAIFKQLPMAISHSTPTLMAFPI